MKKDNLNSCLQILNILLCLYTYVTLLVCFVIMCIAENSFIPNCLIFLSILAKIFLLYVFFSIFEKFYPYSKVTKIAQELKVNKSSRKSALLLSFTFDAVIMLCLVLFFSLKDYHFEWSYILVYEILTLGGVFTFYLPLFGIWKIQGKLNKNSQLQDVDINYKDI